MWQLITQYFPLLPPRLQESDRTDLPPNYCADIYDIEYEWVDEDFKRILSLCMAHDPSDRPSLQTLLETAEQGITREYPEESDDEIRSFIRRMVRIKKHVVSSVPKPRPLTNPPLSGSDHP